MKSILAKSLAFAVAAGAVIALPPTLDASASDGASKLTPCEITAPITLEALDRSPSFDCDPGGAGLLLDDGRLAILPPAGLAVSASYANMEGIEGPSDYFLAVTSDGQVGLEIDGKQGLEMHGTASAIAELRGPTEHVDLSSDVPLRDTPATCVSEAYALLGHNWSGGYSYQFSLYPAPDMANFAFNIVNAGITLQLQSTNCAGNDYPIFNMPTLTYSGTTSSRPNLSVVNDVAACGFPDGASVHGFEFFTGSSSGFANTLGLACTWSGPFGALWSDVGYDIQRPWHFSADTPCTGANTYDFRSVSMHEWGHVWGLDHVPNAEGQIMRPTFSPCFTQHTLGLGDLHGLATLYG